MENFEILTTIAAAIISFMICWKFRARWNMVLPFVMAVLTFFILPEIYYWLNPYQGGGASFYGFVVMMFIPLNFMASVVGLLAAYFIFKPKPSKKSVP